MRFILALCALHCLAFIDRTLIGGMLPSLRASITMSDAQAGWIIGAAFALPYGATALAVAALLRGNRASPASLGAGVLVWTAGSVATGLAGSLSELTVARIALGVGQGIFVPIAIATLFDSANPAGRSRALGLFIGSATAGRSVALLTAGLGLWLIALFARDSGLDPWRWLFIATALPNILVLIALGFSRGPISPSAGENPRVAVDWLAVLPFFLVAIGPVLLAQSVLSWLPTLFVRERGLLPTDAALFLGAVTLVAAPAGPFLAGWLAARYRSCEDHVPTLVLVALTATLVPLAGMVWAPDLATATICLAVMLVTLGMATFGGLFGVQLVTPPGARINVNGVYLAFITAVGLGLGPVVTGALITTAEDDMSLGHSFLITAVIAIAICALAVAATRRSGWRRSPS